VIAALLLLIQITLAPPQPAPIATTIAAIRADPKKFDGHIVRLHGWVNKCETATCDLEEHPATASGGPGASLSIAGDPKFDATIKPLLPTYVEFDARVDASCIVAPCLDRGSALTVIQLRGVVDPTAPPPED
jgi:hypothetical protein